MTITSLCCPWPCQAGDDDDNYEDDFEDNYNANDDHLLMLSMTVSSRAVSRSGLSRLAPSWDIGVDLVVCMC